MTAEQFVYWLQGFIEIEDPRSIDPVKTQIIKDHLKLVFDKQTPVRSNPTPTYIPTLPLDLPNNPKPYLYTVTCTDSSISPTNTGKLLC